MNKKPFEYFHIATCDGDSKFIANLNSTDNEESRLPIEFFQRQCQRIFLSFIINNNDFFQQSDVLVITGSQMSVVRQNPSRQGLNVTGKVIVPLTKLIKDFDLFDRVTPATREAVALRQCVLIANNVCRYMILAFGEDVFLRLCTVYKNGFLGLEPEEVTHTWFSEFARNLADSPEVSREAVLEQAFSDFEKSFSTVRRTAGIGILLSILFLGLFIGLATWAISTRGFGIGTLVGILCVPIGVSGVIQSFRKQDTIDDMIRSGRDLKDVDAVRKKIRVIGIVLFALGIFFLR